MNNQDIHQLVSKHLEFQSLTGQELITRLGTDLLAMAMEQGLVESVGTESEFVEGGSSDQQMFIMSESAERENDLMWKQMFAQRKAAQERAAEREKHARDLLVTALGGYCK